MAEPQETQQEKETRWAAQRAAHETQQQDYRGRRGQRTSRRNWLVVGAIVIIVAVMAAAMLR